jgi:8-amino-7-oxononanoate synthase
MVRDFYRQMQPDTLLDNFGPGAAASRLMTGNSPLYNRLEDKLAALYGKENCLVFNSGYHGNAGILPAVTTKGDLILADKLCHASLLDGMRLSMAEALRFRHLDYDHLDEILSTRREKYNQVFLVSESIFSMDGDRAELDRLIALKKKYRCCLYLDEAHAVGVFGRQGLGLAEQQSVIEDIDLLFGTFGKAFAGVGGFVACSKTIADYLINRARTLIFTTGLPPVCLSWLLFVLERVPFMEEERNRLQRIAETMCDEFIRQGLSIIGNSQIVPVLIGDSARAVSAARKLRDHGYWVTAVRPPTVPPGTARLRLSFSAAMDENDLAPLPKLLASVLH